MSQAARKLGLMSEFVLPERASDYLRPDNPRLSELRRRYENHPASRHSIWSQHYLTTQLRLDRFREDNVYLHQRRRAGRDSYLLTARYVQSVDKLGLLHKLGDDDAFGNYVFGFDGGLPVSRDLLDSVLEINFLDEHLDLKGRSSPLILDIGAGYGRLAYRLVQAIPNLEAVLCADAIAESTFLSEFYLKFRGCETKAKVLPLDEVEAGLSNRRIDIALNVHSFGECSLESIRWWLDLISARQIPYLFIVPNGEKLHSWEADNARFNYAPLILERGYKLIAKQPNYAHSVTVRRYGLYPCYYYLFARN
jgi:putative sugar O-methyltransferase